MIALWVRGIWKMALLCLYWTIQKERTTKMFGEVEQLELAMKNFFIRSCMHGLMVLEKLILLN